MISQNGATASPQNAVGAAVYGETLTVTDSTITQNSRTGLKGKVLSVTNSTISTNGEFGVNSADDFGTPSLTLTDSAVSDNASAGVIDRGLGSYDGSLLGTLTVTHSRLVGNGTGIISGKSGQVTVTDSTISDSKPFPNAGGGGGGISASHNVLLTNSVVTRNRLTGIGSEALVTLRNSQVTENSGTGVNATSVILESSTVVGNRGAGGIFAAIVEVTNSRVDGNTGVLNGGIRAGARVSVTNSSVSGNTASGSSPNGGTGGIESPNMVLTNSTVSGNSGASAGGLGVFAGFGAGSNPQATVTASTISGNSSTTSGGGIRLSEGVTLTLVNSTVSGNSATTGGGIAEVGSATVHLINSTIANNTATSGGSGVHKISGPANFRNMIVANNTGSPNCFFATPITTLGNNLSSDASCAFSGPNDRNSTDRKLGPLANNGGPTFTHALLTGSPAVDFGNPDGCPVTDQRGFPRPQDGDGNPPGSCDIGAFEAAEGSSPPPSSCSPRPPVTVTSAPDGAGRLRVTVSTTGIGGALSVIRFGAASNAQIDAPGGPPNATGTFEVTPPAGATSYTFTVRRVTAGQGTQVPFIAVDACGNWPTFVGGGPSAF